MIQFCFFELETQENSEAWVNQRISLKFISAQVVQILEEKIANLCLTIIISFMKGYQNIELFIETN